MFFTIYVVIAAVFTVIVLSGFLFFSFKEFIRTEQPGIYWEIPIIVIFIALIVMGVIKFVWSDIVRMF